MQSANQPFIGGAQPRPMGLLGGGAGRDDGGSGIGTRGYQAAPPTHGQTMAPQPPPAPEALPWQQAPADPAPDTNADRAGQVQDGHHEAIQQQAIASVFTPVQQQLLQKMNQSDPGRVQQIIQAKLFAQDAEGMTPYQRAQQDLEERKFQFAQDKAGQQDPTTQIEHIKITQQLRKEYAQVSGDFRAISDGYGKVTQGSELAKTGNGAGDLAIVFGVMKMLDPTSVVREGEAASAGQVSGAASQYLNLYNQIINGGALPPEARTQLLAVAKGVYQQKSIEQERIKQQFGMIAERGGIPPDEVLMDLGSGGQPAATSPAAPAAGASAIGTLGAAARGGPWPGANAGQPQGAPPQQIRGDADYTALPSGAQFVDPNGNLRTKP